VSNNVGYTSESDLVDFDNEYVNVIELYTCFNVASDREDVRVQTFKDKYDIALKQYKTNLRLTNNIN